MKVKINRQYVNTLLAARDMTSRDLARETGLGEATIYKVLAGSAFSSETLGKIASALEVDPGELISTSEVLVQLQE
jgi:DNA-binding Xre family transcriptional regulator